MARRRYDGARLQKFNISTERRAARDQLQRA
jgi:hypothetical protein